MKDLEDMRDLCGLEISESRFLGNRLGYGSGGTVFVVHNDNGNIERVIKVTNPRNRQTLERERAVYSALHKDKRAIGFPSIYELQDHEDFTGLFMERLDYDLFELKTRLPDGSFSNHAVYMIAIQLLERLEKVHEAGYIHRDVTPQNMMTGRGINTNIMYLIDMGLCKKIYFGNEENTGRKEGKSKRVGSDLFYSYDTLIGNPVSMKDDLISLGYSLQYLIHGKLPWSGKKESEMIEMKTVGYMETTVGHLPDIFSNYFMEVESLRFNEFPNYPALIESFKEGLRVLGYTNDKKFTWTSKGMYEKEEMYSIFEASKYSIPLLKSTGVVHMSVLSDDTNEVDGVVDCRK